MKLPVFRILADSLMGALAAFCAIPLHFLVAFALLLVIDLVTEEAQSRMGDYYVQAHKDLVRELFGIPWSAAIVPLAIAVHRFNLLGERMDVFGPLANGGRFFRYFAWSVGITAFLTIPALLSYAAPEAWWSMLLSLAVIIAAVIILIVIVPLFSAIAVDDPETSFAHSAAVMRGNRLRMLCVYVLLVIVPMVLLLPALIYRWSEMETGSFVPLSAIGIAISAYGALILLAVSAVVVILSNEVYRRLWRA